jgi:mono/diheme cytochrome c family protein
MTRTGWTHTGWAGSLLALAGILGDVRRKGSVFSNNEEGFAMDRLVTALGVMLLSVGLLPATGWSQAVTYAKDIEPLFKARCVACHGANSPLIQEFDKDKDKYTKQMKGPRMDSYKLMVEFVSGGDAGALMRRLDDGKNTKDSKPGNMYQYLGADDAARAKNLQTVKGWVGHWTLKRKAELTAEERKGFLLKEK